MIALGPTGTIRHGLSGTAFPDDREPLLPKNGEVAGACAAPNRPNRESFGFLLTSVGCGQRAVPSVDGVARAGQGDRDDLTHVTLFWQEGRQEHWLRFGKPVASRILDRRHRVESYAPGQVFAFVRWASNDHGTALSHLAIVRAVSRGMAVTRLPHVEPGGEILLCVRGWRRVSRVFALIDAIEALGIEACEVAPDHWRHIHNRLAGQERPRPYDGARHAAWLCRRDLQS